MTVAQATDATVHAADCGVWDQPGAERIDALIAAGYEDEAVARYLAEARPVYDALGRVLAQLSGVLLLAMTSRRALSLDHAMFRTAREQLAEAAERLASIRAPAAAARHVAALGDLAEHLAAAARGMDRAPGALVGAPREERLRETVKRLQAAQRLLIASAEPDARIAPVDFSHACCSCGAAQRGAAPGNTHRS